MKRKKSKNVKVKTLLASVAFFTAFNCSNLSHRYNPDYNKYKDDGKSFSWDNKDRTSDRNRNAYSGVGHLLPMWFLWHTFYPSYYYSNYVRTPASSSYVKDINNFNSTRNFSSGSAFKSMSPLSSATPKATSRGGFGSYGKSISVKS